MKKGLQTLGITLIITGLILTVGIFQIPYCIGTSLGGYCIGIAINLGFYFGILFITIGVVVYLVGRKKRR